MTEEAATLAPLLRNAPLSPVPVAHAWRVAIRDRYSRFEDEGAAVGSWIRRARVDRGRSDIDSPTLFGRSVRSPTCPWAFSDAAHFSDRFGMSPPECRTANGQAGHLALTPSDNEKA